MKVLIIGATGTLAKPVIEHLASDGHELRLLSRHIDATNFDPAFACTKGDLFKTGDLQSAMEGMDAIHLNLDKLDEAKATEIVAEMARQKQIKLISTITGSTVCEENRWSPRIDMKFRAEQVLVHSGIPYLIFRPSWFFESLEMMIRKGKATLIGKHPKPFHWVAGDDYGRMVAEAYNKAEVHGKIFRVLGPKTYRIDELMRTYVSRKHPEIKKVSTISLGMMKFMGNLTGKKELKEVAELFNYFETVNEPGPDTETEKLLYQPEMDFDSWMKSLP